MSHATDGELHAFLDGALSSMDPDRADRLRIHLEGCSDCAARLEGARALHARAGEILAEAGPVRVAIPPFETILERAGASGPTGVDDSEPAAEPIPLRRARPPLAWAASVVVAIGAGWLAHAAWSGAPVGDIAGTPAAESPMARGAREVEGAGSPTRGASVERAENIGFAEDEDRRRASEAQEPTATGSLERGSPAERSHDASGALGLQTERGVEGRLANRPDELTAESSRIALSELVAARPSREPEREAVPRAAAAGEGDERLRYVQKVAQDAVAAQDTPAELESKDLEAGLNAREEETRRRLAQHPGEYFRDERTAYAGAQTSWLQVSREDAEHWIGGSVLEVSGLPPASLAIASVDGVRVVRALQTLPGGETLELLQEARAVDETARELGRRSKEPVAPLGMEADLDPSVGVVLVVERDGFRVTARAQVAADSLRILLSRLR